MARQKNPGPLTDEHRRQLDEAMRAISDAMPVIQQMEACGIDCQQDRQLLADYERKLRQYRDTFFPQ